MKKIIEYEKDIIFKTKIGEICSISLENEFNVEGNYLKGDFTILGEYKSNELSVNKESFEYKLPLEYELEDNVDLSSIVYEIENFESLIEINKTFSLIEEALTQIFNKFSLEQENKDEEENNNYVLIDDSIFNKLVKL